MQTFRDAGFVCGELLEMEYMGRSGEWGTEWDGEADQPCATIARLADNIDAVDR